MADDAKLNTDEAKELERLLADEGIATPAGEPTAASGLMANKYVAMVRDYVSTHKKQSIIIGASLLLLIVIGVTFFFIHGKEGPVEVKVEPTSAAKEEVEEVIVQKVNSLKLDPFFIVE